MIELSSPAFQPDGSIPSKFTCDGDGVSPPLNWAHIPDNTRSVALLVDDPDATNGPFLHWLVTDIPPDVDHLYEGGVVPHEAFTAESDAGTASYFGPCPVGGKHTYRFHLYALDMVIGHRVDSREAFLSEIQGHILDEGEILAQYQRVQA